MFISPTSHCTSLFIEETQEFVNEIELLRKSLEEAISVLKINTNIQTFPRKSCINLLTKPEKIIYDAVQEVENIGADERLTKAIILLGEAQDLVSDFINEQIINKR